MKDQELNQLKKGILKIIVLKLISEDKTYGYELIAKIDRESQGLFKMKEGTLYPILYKLEDEGLIQSEWQNPEGKQKAKKYYVITTAGQEKLKEWTVMWKEFSEAVQAFL